MSRFARLPTATRVEQIAPDGCSRILDLGTHVNIADAEAIFPEASVVVVGFRSGHSYRFQLDTEDEARKWARELALIADTTPAQPRGEQ